MTAITRTKTMLDVLANKNIPNVKVVRIVESYLTSYSVDFSAMTNEQKANKFLTLVLNNFKGIVSSVTRGKAQRTQEAAEDAAEAAALQDFEEDV